MMSCPPHLGRNFRHRDSRRRQAEERKLSHPKVAAALPQVKHVFAEEEGSWKYKRNADMDIDEVKTSKSMWALADAEDVEDTAEMDSASAPEEPNQGSIRTGMPPCLRQWKVTCRELHNATLAAGLPVPARPSWLN